MKNIIITLLLSILVTGQSFAQDKMSESEISTYLREKAYEIREDYWGSGYDEVEILVNSLSKELIDQYIKVDNNSMYEEPLDDVALGSIYRCHFSKTCTPFQINISAVYKAGYSINSHFILLNLKSRKHHEIAHLVYAE